MTSWLDDALTVVRRGMQLEREGHDFYVRAAQRTSDPGGSAMFQALARDELSHLAVLQEQEQALLEGGTWKQVARSETPEDPSHHLPNIFPGSREDTRAAVKAEAGDLDALQFGIEVENKSYRFYDDLARKAAQEAPRTLFSRLAKEEEGHRKLLQDTYDYLSDPAGWFQREERPIFEG